MRRTSFLTYLWLALAMPIVVAAQPANEPPPAPPAPAPAPPAPAPVQPAAPAEAAEPAEPAEPAPAPAEPAEIPEEVPPEVVVEEGDEYGEPPQLEPPELPPIEVPPEALEDEPELPDPAEAAARLEETEPEEQEVAEQTGWTLPKPVFSIHGYFRVRANLMRKMALGRTGYLDRRQVINDVTGQAERTSVDPFGAYRVQDRFNVEDVTDPNDPPADTVAGGCGKSAGADGRCKRNLQVSTDLRLRLKPEIAMGEDVRVKMWIDVFDNVVFGSAPRDPNKGIDLADTITARRAWGEVRDRDLGELRFGRMGADWGLGILDNGGDRGGIDSDFSSDVDRIMGITNLAGFYLMGAYDWAAQGAFIPGSSSPSGVPIDKAQKDDLNEITLAVAYRGSPEEEETALARGDAVVNAGAYFIWRKRLIRPTYPDGNFPTVENDYNPDLPYTRVDEKQFIPDLWFKLQWQGLRVEMESTFVAGTMRGGCPRVDLGGGTIVAQNRNAARQTNDEQPGVAGGTCKLRQFGVALESEYRLIDDRLGIYFSSGFASGDRQGYGLAYTNNTSLQRVDGDEAGNRTVSTFAFHPDYRIDLILWRTLMRRVAGAYYFKPGISFDFLRSPFGRRLGGEFDIIYSRSSTRNQTWGFNSNMGVELDLRLYYRSEDGPDPLDGFYAMTDFGVLFPLKGLQERTTGDGFVGGNDPALMFRTVLGIAF